MDRAGVIRSVTLLVPVCAALVGIVIQALPGTRVKGAACLSTLWCFCTLLPLNVIAQNQHWWQFKAEGATLVGVPVDMLLGWSVMWGVLPALFGRSKAWLWVVMFLWLDVLTMNRLSPVVLMGDGWLMGELLAIAVALVPSLVLTRLTVTERMLHVRVALQVVLFALLTMYVVPEIVFSQTNSS